MDIVQAANEGLCLAVLLHDSSRHDRAFYSYAEKVITGEAVNELARMTHPVNIPKTKMQQIDMISRVRRDLEMMMQRSPTTDEWAAAAGLSVTKLRTVMSTVPRFVGYDAAMSGEDDYSGEGDEDGLSFSDTITSSGLRDDNGGVADKPYPTPEEYIEEMEIESAIADNAEALWEEVHKVLTALEAETLLMHLGAHPEFSTREEYSQGMAVAEIARELGVRHPTISKRISNATAKLQRSPECLRIFILAGFDERN